VCVSFNLCDHCLLYHTLKNARTCRINNDPASYRFSELNQSANEESEPVKNGESNSCETSSVDELNVDKTERNGSEPDLSSSLSSSD